MNVKHLAALVLLSASAGAVLADTTDYPMPHNSTAASSLTRAEVESKVDLRRADSQPFIALGDASYPPSQSAESIQSAQSRQEDGAAMAAAPGSAVSDSSYSGS